MQTSEEYFSELAACLKPLPAAERGDTLAYYREYAEEGGLIDAGRLTAHFGPPAALAAHILADAAGRKSGSGVSRISARLLLPGCAFLAAAVAGLWTLVAFGAGVFSGQFSAFSPANWMKLWGVLLLAWGALGIVLAALWHPARPLLNKLLNLADRLTERRGPHA